MKKTFSLLMILCSLLLACGQEDVLPLEVQGGTYTGSFSRSAPHVKYAPSQVSLQFSNGHFEGSSSEIKYPAICRGTYTINGQEITFENGCFWTAEFDWTYILSGTFQIRMEGDELILTRSYGQGVSDTYSLKRK